MYLHRKFILGTAADGSPRKYFYLTKAATPWPVDFVVGRFRAQFIVLPYPSSWAELRGNREANVFDEEVDMIFSDLFIQEIRSKSNCTTSFGCIKTSLIISRTNSDQFVSPYSKSHHVYAKRFPVLFRYGSTTPSNYY